MLAERITTSWRRLLFGLALAVGLLAAAPVAGAAPKPSCTPAAGQAFIEQGRYDRAVREFTCLIDADPTGVEGYRGRIEAQVLLGRYADAIRDYTRVTAIVKPVHPDAWQTILDGYAARLAADPDDVKALTGASFARWWFFEYPPALQLLNQILKLQPDNAYATLFRGSSRQLHHSNVSNGIADLDRAIELAPTSADVRQIVADAFTYGGTKDFDRAYAEASLALVWGLDNPRVHAILAQTLNAFGDVLGAVEHIDRHLDLVTTELVPTAPIVPGDTFTLPLVPGRTFAIPVFATAGQTISIATSSPDADLWDTIMALDGPNGSPVVGADDTNAYWAALDWVAPATGTYVLRVTSFEAVTTGQLVVTRS
jgi:predicted Zn-dependent protease